jgi:hypothetical protein
MRGIAAIGLLSQFRDSHQTRPNRATPNRRNMMTQSTNVMTATNLATGAEQQFSHSDPWLALSYLYAEETSQLTHWGSLPLHAKLDLVAHRVRVGKRSWACLDWAIPFFDESTQKGMYLENRGLKCPRCLSDDIEGGSVDIDGPEATQDVSCNVCDATWTDIYTMTDVRL